VLGLEHRARAAPGDLALQPIASIDDRADLERTSALVAGFCRLGPRHSLIDTVATVAG